METSVLIEKFEKLPEPLKKEVEDFVDFLIFKEESQDKVVNTETIIHQHINGEDLINSAINDLNGLSDKNPKLKREYGGLKGQIWMSDDFDEPLEDFKDYM